MHHVAAWYDIDSALFGDGFSYARLCGHARHGAFTVGAINMCGNSYGVPANLHMVIALAWSNFWVIEITAVLR